MALAFADLHIIDAGLAAAPALISALFVMAAVIRADLATAT
jgi:hypothetical protein